MTQAAKLAWLSAQASSTGLEYEIEMKVVAAEGQRKLNESSTKLSQRAPGDQRI
jgi:hypothetical protein